MMQNRLPFGFGAHVCLGQHLARMEMSILFKELLPRLEHVELAGKPKYTQATFVGGLKSLPIRYKLDKNLISPLQEMEEDTLIGRSIGSRHHDDGI